MQAIESEHRGVNYESICSGVKVMEELKCPFCGNDGYDKIGLKYHLETHCKEYANTFTVQEERSLNNIKKRKEV